MVPWRRWVQGFRARHNSLCTSDAVAPQKDMWASRSQTTCDRGELKQFQCWRGEECSEGVNEIEIGVP
ncbi:hypothetical protein I305_06833 [Cryptococcus gattii E566]|nr:hypothetical protein I305_06833 [Cryptococcus gattii E566]